MPIMWRTPFPTRCRMGTVFMSSSNGLASGNDHGSNQPRHLEVVDVMRYALQVRPDQMRLNLWTCQCRDPFRILSEIESGLAWPSSGILR